MYLPTSAVRYPAAGGTRVATVFDSICGVFGAVGLLITGVRHEYEPVSIDARDGAHIGVWDAADVQLIHGPVANTFSRLR